MPSLLEHTLNRALDGRAATPEQKAATRRLAGCIFSGLRWTTRLGAGGYLLLLVILWQLFRHVGERNLTLAFGVYLPPAGWALPLLILLPAALLFDWLSLAFGAAAALLVVTQFMGWEWHSPRTAPAGAPVLSVLSFNRGESKGSLEPFKNAMAPDVLLLQDASSRQNYYSNAPGYEEFKYGDSIGQFTIASKFPITGKELIVDETVAVAGRFAIEFQGRTVVIYNMHLPTPREPLRALFRGAFLWGTIGIAGPWKAKRESYEGWWHTQIGHVEAILRRAEAETQPCILAGDSNSPAPGYMHYLLTQKFTDSHEAAGSGCGMTFPGTTHNPLSAGGPWMRIDKILGSSEWEPLWNKAEPARPSQHRAVAAAFALVK